MLDKIRNGNFKSSQNSRLMATPKAFNTYVDEVKRERRLLDSINKDVDTRDTAWGTAFEKYVFDNYISLDYDLCSSNTLVHKYFVGTPDYKKITPEIRIVGDIKCPSSKTSFMDLLDIFELMQIDQEKGIDKFRIDEPKYFWQLISNSILLDCTVAELTFWMPKKSELKKCFEYINNHDDFEIQKSMQWLTFIDLDLEYSKLPYIKDECQFSNCNTISFEIPQDCKNILISQLEKANKLL